MAAIFHFQFFGEAGWQSVGAAEGDGSDPVLAAFRELRQLCGGKLPPGCYRVMPLQPADARWETFQVDAGGRMLRSRFRT